LLPEDENDNMGWMSKLGWLVFTIVIIVALLYFFDEPTFCNMFSSVMNPNISSKICGSTNHISPTISKMLGMEANAINSSSPVPIKQFFIFGEGTTIQNTTNTEFANMFYNFSLQKTSYLYVLNNGFYVPTYEVIEETYYKANSSSMGDYLPSLIGKKVYLDFIDAINKTYSENTSAPYIIKTENIQGNEVIWNLTYDGNINNAINPNNSTTLSKTISWLNGIIFTNGTALLSPVPYFTNTTKSQ